MPVCFFEILIVVSCRQSVTKIFHLGLNTRQIIVCSAIFVSKNSVLIHFYFSKMGVQADLGSGNVRLRIGRLTSWAMQVMVAFEGSGVEESGVGGGR